MYQQDFPACSINHNPKYFCCDHKNGEKYKYTMYRFPLENGISSSYRSVLEHGWFQETRQVNFPYKEYTPSTPSFRYNIPNEVCRVRSIYRQGLLEEELQCGQSSNASLPNASSNPYIFFTYDKNSRNNNASCPDGAIWNEIFSLEEAEKCVSDVPIKASTFHSLNETPFLLIYFLYIFGFILLFCWKFFKKRKAFSSSLDSFGSIRSSDSCSSSSSSLNSPNSLLTTLESPLSSTFSCFKERERKSYKEIPLIDKDIEIRTSDVLHVLPIVDMKEKGFKTHPFGIFLFSYLCFLTLLLNLLIVLVLMDSYLLFKKSLFPQGQLLSVFIFLFFLTLSWTMFLLVFYKKIITFFYIESSLDSCEYLSITKPEATTVMFAETSKICSFVYYIESFFKRRKRRTKNLKQAQKHEERKEQEEQEEHEYIIKVCSTQQGRRYIEFQHIRYIYIPLMDKFLPMEMKLRNRYCDFCSCSCSTLVSCPSSSCSCSSFTKGLSSKESLTRLDCLGMNGIDINMPSIKCSLKEEFFSAFYLYQLFCYYVWFYYSYWYMAFVMLFLISISAFINIRRKRFMQSRVRELSKYSCSLNVFRDSQWMKLSSKELVPGDLLRIEQENWILPCDMILLDGNLVLDESNLTGESIPIRKKSILKDSKELYLEKKQGKEHTLLAGTKVISFSSSSDYYDKKEKNKFSCSLNKTKKTSVTSSSVTSVTSVTSNSVTSSVPTLVPTSVTSLVPSSPTISSCSNVTSCSCSSHRSSVLCVVTKTGATTSQGELLRHILFPLRIRFKHDEHLKVLIIILFFYALIASYFAISFLMKRGNLKNKLNAFGYVIFMLCGIVSPLLPVVLTLGQVAASKRLEENKIFTLNTQRIALAGKIRIFSFDKTGTLTKQGLDFLGCLQLKSSNEKSISVTTNSISSVTTNSKSISVTTNSKSSVTTNSISSVTSTKPSKNEHQEQQYLIEVDHQEQEEQEEQGLLQEQEELEHLTQKLSQEDFDDNNDKEEIGFEKDLISKMNLNSFLNERLMEALGCCHNVSNLNSSLVGNELEIKMFEATNWVLIEEPEQEERKRIIRNPFNRKEYKILKCFEFDHKRMLQSIVLQDLVTNQLLVYSKGSYEKIKESSISSSFPSNYKKTCEEYAKKGYYILSIAYKVLEYQEQKRQEQEYDRDSIENNLSFLGLLMFKNEVKEDSYEAIQELRQGDIRCLMITGDNAMCGYYVAKECGMIASNSLVLFGEIKENLKNVTSVSSPTVTSSVTTCSHHHPKSCSFEIQWTNINNKEQVYSTEQVKLLIKTKKKEIELAITGEALRVLLVLEKELKEKEELNEEKKGKELLLKDLLLSIRIFSRMTPEDKVICIEMLMKKGIITGMCGDGGNDCGALRTAHVGIALSSSSCSLVSPFTSKLKSLKSVIEICKEGRCSLATSFANVKFLVLYGIICSSLRLVQYHHGVIMSEWCWILADAFNGLGCSYFITRTCSLKILGKERPTSSLLGVTTLSSLIGQIVLNILFLLSSINFLTKQSWYCPFVPDNVDLGKWWLLSDNAVSTCLFFSIITQQQTAAFVFSFGGKFRISVFKNIGLCSLLVVLAVLELYLLLGSSNSFTDLFRIASSTNVVGLPDIPLPLEFRKLYLLFILSNILSVIVFEYFIVLGFVRDYLRKKFHKDVLQLKL